MNPTRLTETARLIVEDHGDILLLMRPETSKSRPGEWDLPGGEVDLKETPEQAACREALEETGLRVSVNDVERISTTVDRDGDRTFIRHYWRIGGMVTRKSVELSTEHTGCIWVAKHKVCEQVIYVPHLIALKHSLGA